VLCSLKGFDFTGRGGRQRLAFDDEERLASLHHRLQDGKHRLAARIALLVDEDAGIQGDERDISCSVASGLFRVYAFRGDAILILYAFITLLLFVPLRIWRDHMLKAFGAALLLASALTITAAQARALQVVVTQVDKNTDGSMTYHFAVKTDQGETLTPSESKATGDFVTVYNFYGLVDGSAKSPAGWEFSSEEFGRTPTLNGYPMVLPLDVPNTPNLTWTVTKPIDAGTQIDGFTATTRVSTMVQGQYTAQVTRQLPSIQGAAGETLRACPKSVARSYDELGLMV
jgi:hypothetical protein